MVLVHGGFWPKRGIGRASHRQRLWIDAVRAVISAAARGIDRHQPDRVLRGGTLMAEDDPVAGFRSNG